jgi:adenylate cyclase
VVQLPGARKVRGRPERGTSEFANLSNDPEQEYFADGITDDLTTDLSRICGIMQQAPL